MSVHPCKNSLFTEKFRIALGQRKYAKFVTSLVGLEPTTPGLGVRCAIHCATETYTKQSLGALRG